MFILLCPCIKDSTLRAKGITKPKDLDMFQRCLKRCEMFGIKTEFLPCPETIYLGRDRSPWCFLDKLDTAEFSGLLEKLSSDAEETVRQKGKPLCIIGVDSSPTCGVNTTYYSDKKEKGRGVFLKKFSAIPALDVSEFSEYKIYFAAPLFSDAERDFNKKMSELLRGHLFEVFLPQETGDNESSREASSNKRIFEENLSALKKCDIVVCVIDGADADSGASWEMGYAYALGKKIIALRTDFRRVGKNEIVNLMLEESAVVVNSQEELLLAINSPFCKTV